MKTVFIGDIHGNPIWKKVIENNPDAGRFVFVGDYFDSFTYSAVEQIANFKDIVEFKMASSAEVVLLIGNHDIHYYPGVTGTATAGFQRTLYFSILPVIEEHKEHLQIAYSFEDVLCTHAGVSEQYMKDNFKYDWQIDSIADKLNMLFQYRPGKLSFPPHCYDPYGDDKDQTPIWIRPKSLMRASKNIRKHYRQVVGHTKMPSLNIMHLKKWTGGNYFFIDTINTSGEYLIREADGTYHSNKIEN